MAAVAVSDVHIGYKLSDTDKFISFLKEFDEHELILLGDIIDLWRKANATVLLKSDEVFELLSTIPKVTYVIGNHDYSLYNYAERYKYNLGINIVKDYYLNVGLKRYYMDHGYVLDVVGNMEPMNVNEYEAFSSKMCDAGEVGGFLASNIYKVYESLNSLVNKNNKSNDVDIINKLAFSRVSSAVLGKKFDDFYIYGHTHKALINTRVANTGCWIKGTPCTYVLIDSGKEYLMEWNK